MLRNITELRHIVAGTIYFLTQDVVAVDNSKINFKLTHYCHNLLV